MLYTRGKDVAGLAAIIDADNILYGEDRAEGGVALHLPFKKSDEFSDEYDVVLGLVHLVMEYMQKTSMQSWDYSEDHVEKDIVCGENPTTSGITIYDTGNGSMKGNGLHFFLNKTQGKGGVSIGWKGGMVLDDQLISLLSKELCDWLKQQLKKDS